MALIDRVVDRIPNSRLVSLTNPDSTTTTTVDLTPAGLLQKAVDDVEADFKIHVGAVYDDTDDRMVAVGVRGVVMKLQIWTGQVEDVEAIEEKWETRLKALSRVTARDRILPRAAFNPDEDRSPFDDREWFNYIPSEPRGGEPLE